MRIWPLWVEGYAATGESAPAKYLGAFEGETFQDAIQSYKDSLDADTRKYVDVERGTFWGCRFFNREEDARKSFG